MIFKTAVLQMRSRHRDIQNNLSIVIQKMEEAKRSNADILLLPECFITGYDLSIGNDEAHAGRFEAALRKSKGISDRRSRHSHYTGN